MMAALIGVNHALAAEGGRTDCRVAGRAGVPAAAGNAGRRGRAVEVRDLRRRSQLTQQEFAARLGVPVETIRNWEQGKRAPRGPARALLAVIAHSPETVFAALAKA